MDQVSVLFLCACDVESGNIFVKVWDDHSVPKCSEQTSFFSSTVCLLFAVSCQFKSV